MKVIEILDSLAPLYDNTQNAIEIFDSLAPLYDNTQNAIVQCQDVQLVIVMTQMIK